MKKFAKNAVKAGIIGTAAVFGIAEIAYESILNVNFAGKVIETFHLEDKKMMDVLLNHPVFTDAYEWFDAIAFDDIAIVDDKGETAHGYILKQNEESKKWAISVHGYRGEPRAQAPYARHLYEQGYNIVFPHMRAHACDTHKYCSMGYYEKDIILAWINYLVNMFPDCEILLHGVSMGSAAVMMVTGEKLPENVKCAVADCGYSSCWDEYAYEMKNAFHLPVFPLLHATNLISKLRGNFDFKKADPKNAVARSKTPTLFIHGTGDEFVPYSMLDVVYNACTAEKERLDVPDAVHAAAVAFDPDGYYSKMDQFAAKYINS